jgi:hypothetical protein
MLIEGEEDVSASKKYADEALSPIPISQSQFTQREIDNKNKDHTMSAGHSPDLEYRVINELV